MSSSFITAVRASALLAVAVLTSPAAHASRVVEEQHASQPVDLVLALDVSGSMSGLIDSARQRLWDVVNELGQARPRPDLRVAVLSYGNPGYGRRSGFVRLDVPLTRDLDAVNAALFGFTTGGGKEYVARVIERATEALDWSDDERALRLLFVAGNESASQDPHRSLEAVAHGARARDIVVNTIYCGEDHGDRVAAGWRQVAQRAGGTYASIDQDVSAVASVNTPYDDRLRELNAVLNETYVPYGPQGQHRETSQRLQDRNAASMSAPAAASRVVTKASEAYRGADWDLVDALESGADLEGIETDALPEEMRVMSIDQRARHVETKARARAEARQEIQRLAKDRADFIEREAAAGGKASEAGLAEALNDGVRRAARAKGFRFE